MKRIEGDGGIQVPESMLKRDSERKEKKLASQMENDDNRRFDYFCETFKKMRQEIEEALEEAKKVAEVDSTTLSQRFREITDKIRLLNKFVFSCTCYLRAYDVRSSKEVIQSLEESARCLENTLLPKKKFGFKNKPAMAVNVDKNSPRIDFSKSVVDGKVVEEDDTDFCGFRHLEGKHCLRLGPEETDGKDIKIHKLDNCTVVLFGNPNTVRISSISDTVLVCLDGRVRTSVMIEDSKNCSIAASCQQLRIHRSHDTDLYLDVTTGPIIEDSSFLGFAPYPPSLADGGMDPESTAWAAVEDFDWLSATKPSPHWRILSVSERITDWPQ